MAWIRMPMRQKFEVDLITKGVLSDDFSKYASISGGSKQYAGYTGWNFWGFLQTGRNLPDDWYHFDWSGTVTITFDEKMIGKRCDIVLCKYYSARVANVSNYTFTYNGGTVSHGGYNESIPPTFTHSFIITNKVMRVSGSFEGDSFAWGPTFALGIIDLHISNRKI